MISLSEYQYVVFKLRHFLKNYYSFEEINQPNHPNYLATIEESDTLFQWNAAVDAEMNRLGNREYWLELELLKKSDRTGLFCITNYCQPLPQVKNDLKNDKAALADKYWVVEFESKGGIVDLIGFVTDLLQYLGLYSPRKLLYEDMCSRYKTSLLKPVHELLMQQEYGNCLSLEQFPERTSPYWNIQPQNEVVNYQAGSMDHQREQIHDQDIKNSTVNCYDYYFECVKDPVYNKVDVLLYGMTTINSGTRNNNQTELLEKFRQYAEGQYARRLFHEFGESTILNHLDDYLSLPRFPHFGGTIQLSKLVRALRFANLLGYTPSLIQNSELRYTEYSGR